MDGDDPATCTVYSVLMTSYFHPFKIPNLRNNSMYLWMQGTAPLHIDLIQPLGLLSMLPVSQIKHLRYNLSRISARHV